MPRKAAKPEVTEPEVTEPEVTEPEVTEPEATEPEVNEEGLVIGEQVDFATIMKMNRKSKAEPTTDSE